MSDATAPLMAALKAVLEADAGVAAAFGANKVRIYDLPPQASVDNLFPYVTLADAHNVALLAENIDGSDPTQNVHVWSRTDPPSTAEAKTIGAAVAKAIGTSLTDLALDGFRLVQALYLDSLYMLDTDGQTCHGVVRIEFSLDPT